MQEPVDTVILTTEPAEFSVTPRQDGFQYYNLSPETLAAGDSFSLQVTYSRSSSELSAGRVQPAATTQAGTNEQSQTPANTGLNWPIIVLASIGAAVLAVGAWMLFGERLRAGRTAPARPKPVRNRPSVNEPETAAANETTTYVQFCHHCGQKSDPSDRFCRSCGTRLKT